MKYWTSLELSCYYTINVAALFYSFIYQDWGKLKDFSIVKCNSLKLHSCCCYCFVSLTTQWKVRKGRKILAKWNSIHWFSLPKNENKRYHLIAALLIKEYFHPYHSTFGANHVMTVSENFLFPKLGYYPDITFLLFPLFILLMVVTNNRKKYPIYLLMMSQKSQTSVKSKHFWRDRIIARIKPSFLSNSFPL